MVHVTLHIQANQLNLISYCSDQLFFIMQYPLAQSNPAPLRLSELFKKKREQHTFVCGTGISLKRNHTNYSSTFFFRRQKRHGSRIQLIYKIKYDKSLMRHVIQFKWTQSNAECCCDYREELVNSE